MNNKLTTLVLAGALSFAAPVFSEEHKDKMSKDKMSTSSDKMDSKEKMDSKDKMDTKDKKMKKKKDKMDKS